MNDVLGVPAAPLVQASIDCTNANLVHLSWSTPDDHGSAITSYNIYRSTNGGPFVLIKNVAVGTNEFTDTITAGQSVQYKVTAINGVGEGPSCSAVTPSPCVVTPPEDPCKVPGATILTDAVGDALDKNPAHDIVKLSIAEPASLGPGKIMFILKMVSLQSVPPDTTWPIVFHVDAPAGDFWVRMSNAVSPTNPTGAVTFSVGTGTNPNPLPNNPGTPADPASGFNADGTISIVIPRGAIGNPAPGTTLSHFLVRIRQELGAVAITPDNMPDSTTPAGLYTIKNGCGATATGAVNVTVNAPPPPQCFEDNDPHIAYDNGWHNVSDSNASGGTFHLNTGKDVQHALKFTFQLQSDTGTLQYFYAKSTKGGTAQVLIDGKAPMTNGTVNYQASAGRAGSGSMHDPFFKDTTGKLFSVTYSFTGKGFHTFELVNLTGPAYVDKFCITNATSSTMATAGPGTTTTSTSALAAGQSLLQSVLVPSNALGFSVAAEADANVPYKLVVIDPSGKVLGTVNSSANGIASVTMPVSTTGLYVIQLVNAGVGPVNIWTAATPQVTY